MYSNKLMFFWVFVLTLSVASVQDINAQRKKKKDSKEIVAPNPTPPAKKDKTVEDLTKGNKKIEGLFTIFQDTVTGGVKLLIKKDQLNKDFIYFSQIADGVTESGHFRGAYQGSSVFHIKQYFDRIDFIAPNTAFYFDKNNAISKSADANISDAVIATGKVLVADEKKGEYLIDADGLFLSETFTTI